MAEGKGGGFNGFADTVGRVLIPQTMMGFDKHREQTKEKDALTQFLGTLNQEPRAMTPSAQVQPIGGFTPSSPIPQVSRMPVPAFGDNKGLPGNFSAQDLPQAQNDMATQRMGLLAKAFPQQVGLNAANRMFAGPTAHEIPEGGSLIYTDAAGNEIKRITGQPKNVKADLATLKFPDGSTKSFNTATQQAAIAAATAMGATEVKTPAAVINMSNTQEGKFDQTMGEGMAKEYMGLQTSGRSAADAASRVQYLGGLLDQIETGTGAPTITALKAGAKRLGIDLEAMGVKDDVGPAQAAQVITNQMALDLRSTANGGGMPGAMSEGDRKFLQQMPAGIEKTKEGNRLITTYWTKMKNREAEVAGWARDYKKQNKGVFDEGFYDYAAKKSGERPLFTADDLPKAVPVPGQDAPNYKQKYGLE